MWDYKVIAGKFLLDGADVVVENPLGKGTLQRILDHYGAEGFELSESHIDGVNREIVVLLKKPKGGAVIHQAPSAAAAGASHSSEEEEPLPERRSDRGGSAKKRRSKADLDRLYRLDN